MYSCNGATIFISETEDRIVNVGEKRDSEFNQILSNLFGNPSVVYNLSKKKQCLLTVKQTFCNEVTVSMDAVAELRSNETEKIHFSSNVPIASFNKEFISLNTTDLPASTVYFGTWKIYNRENYIIYIGENGELIINSQATFIGTYVWPFLLVPLFHKKSSWTKFDILKNSNSLP
ncbi:hypothetical protein [Leptospira neocaledonica]|uniref:hypothetical protein n=1 Tax=Leptospira neocaledonica TaxID=2023192 RepID=UPI000F64DAC8|nr:hypothetical protein [Leptospira neocaledonica]